MCQTDSKVHSFEVTFNWLRSPGHTRSKRLSINRSQKAGLFYVRVGSGVSPLTWTNECNFTAFLLYSFSAQCNMNCTFSVHFHSKESPDDQSMRCYFTSSSILVHLITWSRRITEPKKVLGLLNDQCVTNSDDLATFTDHCLQLGHSLRRSKEKSVTFYFFVHLHVVAACW